MAQKKNTFIYLAAALLFAGGLGWLVFSGLSENSVYFLNVAEAKAQDPAKLASARLFGTVAPQGLARPDGAGDLRFLLEDKDDKAVTLAVSYRGTVPDTFKEGAEVIVEGGMQKDGGPRKAEAADRSPAAAENQQKPAGGGGKGAEP